MKLGGLPENSAANIRAGIFDFQRRKAADPEALRTARGLPNRSFRRAKVPRRGSIRKRNFKLEGSDINLCRLPRRSDVRCFEGRIGSSPKDAKAQRKFKINSMNVGR